MDVVTEQQLYRAKPRAMLCGQLGSWMFAHGVGKSDVAKACQVDRRTVYRWIKGLNRIPRTVWPRLAQVYGDPLPHFLPLMTDPRGNEWLVHPERRIFELWPKDSVHEPQDDQ